MNNIAAEDMLARKDVKGGVNLYHSQGTIILDGASGVYADKYMKPVLTYPSSANTDWSGSSRTQEIAYTNQIDNSQIFVAAGPAVIREYLSYSIKNNLHLDPRINYDYIHDPKDSVRYLAAPSNIINQVANLVGAKDFNSLIYIPNPIDPLIGLWNLPNIDHHSVTNSIYFAPIKEAK